MIQKRVVFASERKWDSTWKGNDQYKQSFSIRLRYAAIRFTVVWYAVRRISRICLTECAVWVAVEFSRIVVFHHALLFFWNVVFDVSAARNSWFNDGIWCRNTLEVRHVVLLILLLVLRIVFLLFYLLLHAWSDLFWRTFHD